MNAKPFCSALALLVGVGVGPALAADLYQWIDSRGDLHFTDTLSNVPASVQNSPRFKVRRGYLTPFQPTVAETPPVLPSEAEVHASPTMNEPLAAVTAPEGAVLDSAPPETTIIVVNNNNNFIRGPGRSVCAHGASCARPLRPDLKERRYIKPEVTDGRMRQYLRR